MASDPEGASCWSERIVFQNSDTEPIIFFVSKECIYPTFSFFSWFSLLERVFPMESRVRACVRGGSVPHPRHGVDLPVSGRSPGRWAAAPLAPPAGLPP